MRLPAASIPQPASSYPHRSQSHVTIHPPPPPSVRSSVRCWQVSGQSPTALVSTNAVLRSWTFSETSHGSGPRSLPDHYTQSGRVAHWDAHGRGSLLERMNSIRDTNGNFDSCNSCIRLGISRLHELQESNFPFVSPIESICSKLPNFSAHVSGVGDVACRQMRYPAGRSGRSAGRRPRWMSGLDTGRKAGSGGRKWAAGGQRTARPIAAVMMSDQGPWRMDGRAG